jgi:peroxiredoxin
MYFCKQSQNRHQLSRPMLYEIIDEEGNVHSYKLRTRPNPVIKKREFRTGDKAPEFVLNPGDILWADKPVYSGRWIHSRELVKRPLVIAFYCEAWGANAEGYAARLRQLHQQAMEAGAEFLALTQTPSSELKALAGKHNFDFNLGYDRNNRISQQFGTYDPNYPVWDRVAGINEDVFSPGLFVISPQEKFILTQLDKDFELDWNNFSLDAALVPILRKNLLKYA